MPAVDGHHAPAQQVDDVPVVGRHQDRRLGLVVDLEEELHDLPAGGRVEVAGRLVGDDQSRLVNERAGDRDALLLATGELTGVLLELAGEAHGLQRLGAPAADLPAGLAQHSQREGDVLVDGQPRKELEVLEDEADLAPVVRQVPPLHPAQLLAVDEDLAAGWLLLPDQEPDEARLAGTRRADQEEEVTFRHREGDVPEGLGAVRVPLPDVLEADEWSGSDKISLQNHWLDVNWNVAVPRFRRLAGV